MNELLDTTELEQALRELGEDIRQGYIETLLRNDRKATGALIDIPPAIVEVQGTVYEVKLSLQDYWKYVEEGTKPHWPPRSAILKWIQAKPVIPRPDRNGRIPSQQSLAFLISRKIAREGTEGSHDLQKTKDAILPYWEQRLQGVLARMWTRYLQRIIWE